MDLKQELDRRSKLGVRDISISPLFEVGKTYNIDRNSPNYEKEDENGTMSPEWNHCWMTWQSKWFQKDDYKPDNKPIERWSNEAYNFKTIEAAQEAKKYLETKLI